MKETPSRYIETPSHSYKMLLYLPFNNHYAMETNLRALSKDIKSYYQEFSSGTNMTSVQKTEQENALRKELQGKGILFGASQNKTTKEITHYNFNFNDYFVNDTGIITDINPAGDFPISLYLAGNITLSYEPRNLRRIKGDYLKDISNAELQHLKLKSEYTFQGEVINCRYDHINDKYHFSVAGNEESMVDKENLKLAKKEGIKRGAVGAFYGFVSGLIAVVGIFIFAGVYNLFSKYPFKPGVIIPVVVALSITGGWAVISYNLKFSEIRKRKDK
jgi:hypothetical protein